MAIWGRTLLFAAAFAWVATVPAGPGRGDSNDTDSLAQQIEREVARGDELELQIDDELSRQNQLLEKIEGDPIAPRTAESDVGAVGLAERADPRIAPTAPGDRDLPRAIFEEKPLIVSKGTWGNDDLLDVIRLSLDADRDGKPEQIRYIERRSGKIVRKEQDRDYDGTLDSWHDYEDGQLAARVIDADGNGRPDAWEQYTGRRMTSRAIDRDNDDVKDAFYRYQGDSLVEERHDSDNDGRIDRRVFYEQRRRTRAEEDRNRDGRMDTWTTYRVVNGDEVVARVESDSKGRGKPDVFETYDTQGGQTVLSKREEDVNGDGKIDVTSIYVKGKLVRREIADPSLVPL